MRMAPINSQFSPNAHSNQLPVPDDVDNESLGDEVDGQLQEDEDPAEIDFWIEQRTTFCPIHLTTQQAWKAMASILKKSISQF